MEEVNVLNRWNALPEECKSMILARLSTKEVARIARVSKEFLKAVTSLRSSVHLLVLPPNLSNSALEGMVAAHPDLKSLSFKRCGLKLKSFVSIIRAAAKGCNSSRESTSKLESEASEKKKFRSLTSVDFRNCMHLLDTDVSLLCSLHTQLEEVDLTNCPCLSDTALLTLSRYQYVEKPNDLLENFKCYPSFAAVLPTVKVLELTSDDVIETEEMFLKNNDAAVFEEIQGLALNGTSHYRTWPRLGGSADRVRRESTVKVKVEEEKLGNSPYAAKRTDSRLAASIPAKKSYAQMAFDSAGLKIPPASGVRFGKEKGSISAFQASQPVNVAAVTPCKEKQSGSSFQAPQTVEVADHATQSTASVGYPLAVPTADHTRRPLDLDPTLTFIDWGDSAHPNSSMVPLTAKYSGKMASSMEHSSRSDSYSLPSQPNNSEIAATSKYHDMYKQYVHEGEQHSATAIPALRDRISSTAAQLSSPIVVPSAPLLAQVDENGTRYTSVKTILQDDRMTRTQTSVYYPKNYDDRSEGSDTARKSSGPKSVCFADATEIKDERLDLSKRAHCSAEAFCRTTNHIGVFTVPDLKLRGKSELPESASTGEVPATGNPRESNGLPGSSTTKSPSQLAICLPGSMVIGGKLRRNKHASTVPSEHGCAFDHDSETTQDPDKNMISEVYSEADCCETKGVRGLREVRIAGCPEITDRGVQALLKGALRSCLYTLDVSRCGGVTNAGLRIPARSVLQQLIAVQMPGISRLVYQLPVQSQLQHLNLAGCYKLEELVLASTSLKSLNLANCKKLTRLQVKCPSLTALNLSLCDNLERFVSFQCGELRSLNVFGCRMLVQSAVSAAVEVATALEELRCGGCDRIERLDLVQPTLMSLEVSGSQALRRLFCQSRVLKVVDASGCKSLVEVYLYSSYLRRMLFTNCALLQILVIPLDAIKETMDAAAARSCSGDGDRGLPDALEISISGCNMPDSVKKNLGKLTKQWHSCFKSTLNMSNVYRG